MSKLPRQISSLAISLLLIATPIAGWSQRWQIFDWYRLQSYSAPSEIAAIADRASMTDYARRLFYVYRAELHDREGFNNNCHGSEQTIVLGCYVEHDGIYIYNVEDDRLDGIIEVTAAHEMLHAAYGRLSSKERQRVDEMTQKEFKNLKDERVLSTVENYRKKDASLVPNELHSIIATEVRNISPQLEEYYKQYFHDRSVVVSLAEKYERAFSARENKIKAYDAELKQLQSSIDSEKAALSRQLTDLNNQRQTLDSYLAAKRYEEYNARVPQFNASVKAYNDRVANIRSLINRFNQIVEQRNAIVLEENELMQAIDSRPQTIDTR